MHWLMQSGELYRMWRCITEVKGRWRDISGFLVVQMVKKSACNVGDLGLIPGLGRCPGGGHGNPLQCSCLENPHGQRSLAGYSPWGPKELNMTEWLSTAHRRDIWSWKDNETVNLCVNILNKQWQLGKQSVSEERLLVDPWVGFMPNRYWNRWK